MTLKCNNLDFTSLDAYIETVKTRPGALIPVLHKAQDTFGFLPEEVMSHVAKKLGIPAAKVFGVVSFYSFFSMTPKGKFNVNVCLGTACFVRGAEKIREEFEKHLSIKPGQTSEDGLFSLSTIRCIGACGLAPVVMVNEKVYGRVTQQQVGEIIDECMAKDGEKT
ncbi:MAG: NAD(P)H-dependent oxidoreductase subunit E [Bacillota bacterium]